MPTPSSSPTGTFEARPTTAPSLPSGDSFAQITAVLDATSLDANAGEPARLSNVAQANVVSSTNQSVQNAVANQQSSNQLGFAVLGRTVNLVSNLGPLEARSSVDVLTNDELAQALAGLQAVTAGGGGGPLPPPDRLQRLLKLLQQVLKAVARIEEENALLKGDGTAAHPYSTTAGLYVTAPVTIAFPGLRPEQVDLTMAGDSVRAT